MAVDDSVVDVISDASSSDDDAELLSKSRPVEQTLREVRGTLFAIGLISFAQSMGMSLIYPFAPFMVRQDFPSLAETDLGFKTGWLESCFSFGQFLASFGWGYASDRLGRLSSGGNVGRRRLLAAGMTIGAFAQCLFGMAGTFIILVIARFVGGLGTGVFSVARGEISEVCSKKNQALGFAVVSAGSGIGTIIGPGIGGLLVHPATTLPDLLGGDNVVGDFFRAYPFCLPNFLGALLMLGAAISSVFVSRPDAFKKRPGQVHESILAQPGNVNADVQISSDVLSGTETTPLLTSHADVEATASDPEPSVSMFAALKHVFQRPNAVIVVLVYAVLSFVSTAVSQVFPLLALLPYEEGGLNFKSLQIGLIMTTAGVAGLVYVLFLYPQLTKHLSSKYTLIFGMGALVIITFAVPPMIEFAGNAGAHGSLWLMWIVAITGVSIFALGTETGFPASMVLTGNVVDQEFLGSVHGASQSMGSLVQALAPIVASSLFAWSHALPNSVFLGHFNGWIMWSSLSILSLMALLLTLLLPRGLDREPAQSS